MFVRVFPTDWAEDGWDGGDSVAFARRLGELGVDVVDCSSGGIGESTHPLPPGYQTRYASGVHRETGVRSMAVGLVRDPAAAEALIARDHADLVALGREALFDPDWPLHAQRAPGGDPLDVALGPRPAGSALRARERSARV